MWSAAIAVCLHAGASHVHVLLGENQRGQRRLCLPAEPLPDASDCHSDSTVCVCVCVILILLVRKGHLFWL